MKKSLILILLSAVILSACSRSIREKEDISPDALPTVEVKSESGGIEIKSGSISISAGSGTADAAIDESLKEIDDIINSIADEK